MQTTSRKTPRLTYYYYYYELLLLLLFTFAKLLYVKLHEEILCYAWATYYRGQRSQVNTTTTLYSYVTGDHVEKLNSINQQKC